MYIYNTIYITYIYNTSRMVSRNIPALPICLGSWLWAVLGRNPRYGSARPLSSVSVIGATCAIHSVGLVHPSRVMCWTCVWCAVVQGTGHDACSVLSANMRNMLSTWSFFSRGQKIFVETSRNMALHPSPPSVPRGIGKGPGSGQAWQVSSMKPLGEPQQITKMEDFLKITESIGKPGMLESISKLMLVFFALR